MTASITHRATNSFWKTYFNLPHSVQQLADSNFQLLKDNPHHPSLHFKYIKDDLWSARVGLNYRALALKEIGGFVWFWIGSHSGYDRLIK